MSFFSDLLYASRSLRANVVFTGIAVVSLALGIGANTAIFSVVESALLRALPYDQPNQLITLRDHQPAMERASVSPGEFLDYQKQAQTLSGLAAYTWQELTLTGNGEPQKLQAAAVTCNFFEVLGAHAELGRLLNSRLDKPGEDRAAVISDAAWHGIFASDPAIVGRVIRLNGNPFHVVGVLRPNEAYPDERQVWVSPRFAVPEFVENLRDAKYNITASYGNHWLIGVGRIRPGTSMAQARAELNMIAKRIGAAHSDSHDHYANIDPLHETLVGNIQPALWVLLGAVALLLLIACANMAGLLLARSTARTRELAVRVALGASRAQIVRLLLSESLLLAVAGGILGVLLAREGLHLIAAYSPYDLPAALAPHMNTQVLFFCLTMTLASALLSGLIPALKSAQIDPQQGLKESSKGSSSASANRLRRSLVMAEIALSVVLLSCACLLIHSFTRLLDVNPGFDSTNVLTARLSLPLSRYGHEATSLFWDKLLHQISVLPDVESAALETYLPMSGAEAGSDIKIEGKTLSSYSDSIGASPDLFRALRVPLLSGRVFNGREREKAPPVAVVNKAFADKAFPNQNPIGKKYSGGAGDGLTTIIGVVGNVRMNGLSEPAPLVMYYNHPQYGVDSANLVVRTRQQSANIASEVRSVLYSLDSSLPLSDVKPLGDYVGTSLAGRRFLLGLLSGFAALAVLLAGVGLYGVLAFSVEQRTREIGIRVALGAARSEVLRLIVGESSLMAAVGLSAGLLGAVWASSLLTNLLFGVTGADYISYLAAAVLVMTIAALASFLPALRATRVDPVTALRYE